VCNTVEGDGVDSGNALLSIMSLLLCLVSLVAEMTMGQRVAGHGSRGSTNLSASRGSRVSTRDPLTHDQVNKIPTSKNRLTNE